MAPDATVDLLDLAGLLWAPLKDQTEFCTSNWVFHEAIDDQMYLKKLFETEIGSTIENIIPACYLHMFRKDLPF